MFLLYTNIVKNMKSVRKRVDENKKTCIDMLFVIIITNIRGSTIGSAFNIAAFKHLMASISFMRSVIA